jgi:hypothetical protein
MAPSQDLVSLAELARRVGRTRSTVWKWCMDGIDGVRLEHWRVGREMRSNMQALEEFSARIASRRLAKHMGAMADGAGAADRPNVKHGATVGDAQPLPDRDMPRARRCRRGSDAARLQEARQILERAGLRHA